MRQMKQLQLRPFDLDDAPAIAELVNDYEVSRWTSSIPYPYGLQDALDWINGQARSGRSSYAVLHQGELAGCVSHWLDDELDWGVRGAEEVGYWVGRKYWGQGIASAALEMLLQRDDFPRKRPAVAKVMNGNRPSERVLSKCGFERVGDALIEVRGERLPSRLFMRPAAVA